MPEQKLFRHYLCAEVRKEIALQISYKQPERATIIEQSAKKVFKSIVPQALCSSAAEDIFLL